MVEASRVAARPRRTAPTRSQPKGRVDVILAGVLTLSTFLVHDLHYVLTTPYWVDESWVAVSTRVPLSQTPQVTSISPLGWTVLLRAVPFGGDQRQRMIPLIFAALGVLVAYFVARNLPWVSTGLGRVAGVLAALAVLLAPSSLWRNDLKQYTADAAVTLTIVLLVSRLERSWSRRRLALLSVVCGASFLISAVALFVAVAAFGALTLVLLVRRRWRDLVEAVGFGAGVGLALGVLYLVFYAPHIQPNLNYYWRAFYLPLNRGLSGAADYLHIRGAQMATYLGMGPLWLGLVLVSAGIITLVLIGQPMVAAILPILLAEMIVLGAIKKYPLFDLRTSHFLTVSFALYAAIGVAGVCAVLSRLNFLVSVSFALVLALGLIAHVRPDIRFHSIPPEDVRTPTAYVSAHLHPTDVVLVSSSANWGFGYYWPRNAPHWRKTTVTDTKFTITYPIQERIVVAPDRTKPAVTTALDSALNLARVTGARVWLVRTHLTPNEIVFWQSALGSKTRMLPAFVGCRLLLLTPPRSGDPAPAYGVTAPIRPC